MVYQRQGDRSLKSEEQPAMTEADMERIKQAAGAGMFYDEDGDVPPARMLETVVRGPLPRVRPIALEPLDEDDGVAVRTFRKVGANKFLEILPPRETLGKRFAGFVRSALRL